MKRSSLKQMGALVLSAIMTFQFFAAVAQAQSRKPAGLSQAAQAVIAFSIAGYILFVQEPAEKAKKIAAEKAFVDSIHRDNARNCASRGSYQGEYQYDPVTTYCQLAKRQLPTGLVSQQGFEEYNLRVKQELGPQYDQVMGHLAAGGNPETVAWIKNKGPASASFFDGVKSVYAEKLAKK